MTEYPVQCFEHNGETYGRYCNPHKEYKGIKPFETLNMEWENFEFFAESNTFPFPSGTIGKTYEKDHAEVVWQQNFSWGDKSSWEYCEKPTELTPDHLDSGMKFRQIFRLIPQPVDKEPEIAHNELYFDIAEIAQDNIIIQDPEKFKETRLKHPWNEKAKKRYHAQVQFDALQFIRDLRKKGYVIAKQSK